LGQLEYHPYVLAHLEPVLELQAKHGILTESYSPLTPILRHPTGGPLKPVLQRIARRLSDEMGRNTNEVTVLLLWTRAQGVIGVTSSANEDHIKDLAAVYTMPQLLSKSEIEEIARIGKTVHFRYYVSVAKLLAVFMVIHVFFSFHRETIWKLTFHFLICQMVDKLCMHILYASRCKKIFIISEIQRWKLVCLRRKCLDCQFTKIVVKLVRGRL
jgi:hypothetical protein